MGDELLSKGTVRVAEAVRRYGIPRSVLYSLMAGGRLAYTQVGKSRLVPVVAIEALLREGMVGAEPRPAAA